MSALPYKGEMEKMSEWEWKRFEAVGRVAAEELTNREAARLLGISERQLRRVRRRVAELGTARSAARHRGRSPHHRLEPGRRELIVQLRQGKYAGFNDQHFTEKLAQQEGLVVSRATVRRLLRAAGIGSVRRRASAHRRRR